MQNWYKLEHKFPARHQTLVSLLFFISALVINVATNKYRSLPKKLVQYTTMLTIITNLIDVWENKIVQK